MALLGLHLGRGEVTKALSYAIPIQAFALGIVLAELLKGKYREWSHFN